MRKVLVVEDETLLASTLVELLSDEGCEVELAGDGLEAEAAMAAGRFALVLLDCGLPAGPSGLELLARWRADGRPEPVILMSGNHQHAEEALGAQAFLAKPFSFSDLLSLLELWSAPASK